MNKYMQLALKEAEIAAQNGEIPIGAVIVKNNQIIAKQHNLKETLNCATRHAELLAIEEASSKLQTWRLNECDIYVTMEPCIMCCGALLQARINKIYYLINNEKFGGLGNVEKILNDQHNNHQVEVEKVSDQNLENIAQNMLKNFFIDKR